MEIESKITGSSLTANEFNQIPDEMENLIAKSGQTPSSSDLTQISKAVAQYAGDGDFYSTSGTENSIVLNAVAPRVAPPRLTNGMRIRFKAIYDNTQEATANVNNLGTKSITKNGEEIGAGKILQDKFYTLIYSSSTDTFELFDNGSSEGAFADINLSNLQDEGNAKFQYAPCSINNGLIGSEGNNNTLSYSVDTITCNPCTITTADGRSKYFSDTVSLDCSSLSDGKYYVLKDYDDGSLSVTKDLYITELNSAFKLLGNPTVVNNNISGFSTSPVKYAFIPKFFNPEYTDTFEIVIDITTGNSFASYEDIFASGTVGNPHYYGMQFYLQNAKLYLTIGKGEGAGNYANFYGTTTLTANTHYKVKISYNGAGTFSIYLKSDSDEDFVLENSVSNVTMAFSDTYNYGPKVGISLDKGSNTYYYPFGGSINLAESYIKVNDNFWWSINGVAGSYWLDISQTPYQMKYSDGTQYTLANNKVYIGDVTVASGVISDLKNRTYNYIKRNEIISIANEFDWDNFILITTSSSNSYRYYTLPDDGMVMMYAYGGGTTSSQKYNFAYITREDGAISVDGGFYASSIAMTYNDRRARYVGRKGETIIYQLYSIGWANNHCQAVFIPYKHL